MKLGVLILKEEQFLDSLIRELEINNFTEITILNSNSILEGKKTKKPRAFSSIRYMLNYVYDESRVVLVETLNVELLKDIILSMFKANQCSFYIIDIESKIL